MATERYKLTQGDNRPYITLTLTHTKTGLPLDLSDALTTVVIHFRAAGTETVLSTLACTKTNGGLDGVVMFGFPTPTLDVAPGAYEGEIEIDFDGDKHTMYNPLKFQVRQQFA